MSDRRARNARKLICHHRTNQYSHLFSWKPLSRHTAAKLQYFLFLCTYLSTKKLNKLNHIPNAHFTTFNLQKKYCKCAVNWYKHSAETDFVNNLFAAKCHTCIVNNYMANTLHSFYAVSYVEAMVQHKQVSASNGRGFGLTPSFHVVHVLRPLSDQQYEFPAHEVFIAYYFIPLPKKNRTAYLLYNLWRLDKKSVIAQPQESRLLTHAYAAYRVFYSIHFIFVHCKLFL